MAIQHRALIIVIFMLLARVAHTQPNKYLTIGHIDTLQSFILGEQRPIWIYKPPVAPDQQTLAPKRYPVLYVLDAEWNFQSVVGLQHYLSSIMGSVNAHALTPEMIIVGIPNPTTFPPTRTRDFTPTKSNRLWNGQPDPSLAASGGGEQFLHFLEKELIPHIESRYATEPYRLVMGHSFGGLLVMNALATKPTLFNAYIAIEPSVWWDQKVVLQRLQQALRTGSIKGRKLFLAVANNAAGTLDTAAVRTDTMATNMHSRALLQLVDMLRQRPNTALQWAWNYYPAQDHASVLPLAEHDGLRFFFHYPPMVTAANTATFDYSVQAIQEYYAGLSNQYGYVVKPPEEMINFYAWGSKRTDPVKAQQLFEFNAAAYPQSMNANSSLASLYEERGDWQKALQYYTTALSLGNDPEISTKIEQLKKASGTPRNSTKRKTL